MNPKTLLGQVWHQVAEEGGMVSKIFNKIPSVNAFAGHHDQLIRYVGMASGPMSRLTVSVVNFPTMAAPSLPMTYAALLPPTNIMTIGSYAATLGRWGQDEVDDSR